MRRKLSLTALASEQDAHEVVTADAIKWEPAPPVLPKGAVFTVLFGNPNEKGPFALRLKMPDGYMIAPHWHTNAEHVTVHSGKFNIGIAEKIDNARPQPVRGLFHCPTPFQEPLTPTLTRQTSGKWGEGAEAVPSQCRATLRMQDSG